MKRLLVISLILGLFFVGCSSEKTGNSTVVNTNQQNESKNESKAVGYAIGNSIEVDGIAFTISSCQVKPIIGDRTKDNYSAKNGEYFAIGNNIVKVADYEQIEIDVKIENKTDKAITFSSVGWSAKLKDGYKFKDLNVIGKIGEQFPSKYIGEGKISIIKEKAINADVLLLTYELMDYNEEWQKAIGAAIKGELTEEQYKAKFSSKPINFELKLK